MDVSTFLSRMVACNDPCIYRPRAPRQQRTGSALCMSHSDIAQAAGRRPGSRRAEGRGGGDWEARACCCCCAGRPAGASAGAHAARTGAAPRYVRTALHNGLATNY